VITNPEFLLLFAPPDVPLTDYSSFGKINVRVLSPLKPIALVALESVVFPVHCLRLSLLEHGVLAYLPHRRISCTYTCGYMTGMYLLATGCVGLSEDIAPGAGRGRRCAQEGYCMESNAGPALSAGMVLAA